MQSIDRDKPNKIKINSKEKKSRMNLFYLRFWLGNLVVFVVNNLMAYFDCQTDEWGSLNLREKGEERKNETFRKMVVLLKWNINN